MASIAGDGGADSGEWSAVVEAWWWLAGDGDLRLMVDGLWWRPPLKGGKAVIRAGENGAPFPLKRRDQLLDYILTLMGHDDDNDGFVSTSFELLRTQALALSACTTLVSVEPKLTMETRNHVMKSRLWNNVAFLINEMSYLEGRAGFFCFTKRTIGGYQSPYRQSHYSVMCNLTHKGSRDGRPPATGGWWSKGGGDQGVVGDTFGGGSRDVRGSAAFVLPSRDALSLGDRVIMYLPRCADTNAEVRKLSTQILDLLFSIALSLPKPMNSNLGVDVEMSYLALSSLEDVIAILKSLFLTLDGDIVKKSKAFYPGFKAGFDMCCALLLVAALHGCTSAICDNIKQSAEASIQAVIEFVMKRKDELNESDVSRSKLLGDDMVQPSQVLESPSTPVNPSYYHMIHHLHDNHIPLAAGGLPVAGGLNTVVASHQWCDARALPVTPVPEWPLASCQSFGKGVVGSVGDGS
ncbi:hypothetical protein Cgig2_011878 [Carnegiea gigantea]|uniref:Uncharacterized protein n=1 Tax=Carnegiea gigantea TaxID=171969 RepID=A0A9Q1K886_9CARY|nr:hypothetical protein Cgig2_011878 [Carnegiea gigantea]